MSVERGNTQPVPSTWPFCCVSVLSVPGVMSLYEVQPAIVSGFGPCPLTSAILFATSLPVTA